MHILEYTKSSFYISFRWRHKMHKTGGTGRHITLWFIKQMRFGCILIMLRSLGRHKIDMIKVYKTLSVWVWILFIVHLQRYKKNSISGRIYRLWSIIDGSEFGIYFKTELIIFSKLSGMYTFYHMEKFERITGCEQHM